MVYIGLEESVIPDNFALHHQVIVDEPLGEGNSIFLSLSPGGDKDRAPIGKRVMTISTHTKLDRWWSLYEHDRAAYEAHKAEIRADHHKDDGKGFARPSRFSRVDHARHPNYLSALHWTGEWLGGRFPSNQSVQGLGTPASTESLDGWRHDIPRTISAGGNAWWITSGQGPGS